MRCAPTAGAALVLCAATAGLLSAQGRPAQPEPPRFASWDEMNLLAHGLLQLGHGLREHVERTRGQLGALERRMAACGNACQGPKGKDAPFKDSEDRVPEGQTPETLQSLQIDLLAPTHLDNGVDKTSRGKRLPKMTQLIGLTPNATHLHRPPRDCQELFQEGERHSGLFQIQPLGSPPFLVNCEMTSDGGWTVIQRRLNGSVDFNQSWEAYKDGFGDPQGGWWFGTCSHSNLNGQYFHSIPRQRQERKKGIFWKTWKGRYYPLQATTLLIQPMEATAAS